MFRDRFWITLLLSVPTLIGSAMVQHLLGFTAPVFPGSPYIPAVFGSAVACSSTKGHTGHTLGAAGGVEAVITALALRKGVVPAGLNLRRRDPSLQANYLCELQRRPLSVAASNSFGFGGSNSCLIFGAASGATR